MGTSLSVLGFGDVTVGCLPSEQRAKGPKGEKEAGTDILGLIVVVLFSQHSKDGLISSIVNNSSTTSLSL